jgi:hypothetical protein
VVYDAERAALEVQDYMQAVMLAAQTALRDAIGKHDLAELIQSRKELGRGLQEALDRKMHDWGIQVQSVEIRDVVIPQALEEAMSRQAQAERERQARIILGTAETEIASKFVEAAELYAENPVALNLRAMNMLYESIVKRGSLMVVPSGLADSLNLPGLMGMAGAQSCHLLRSAPHATQITIDPRQIARRVIGRIRASRTTSARISLVPDRSVTRALMATDLWSAGSSACCATRSSRTTSRT